MLPFHLVHLASANFDFYPKMSKTNFVFNIFKDCTRKQICALACIKAKPEEKLFKHIPCTDQKQFSPFWGA